MTAISKAVQVAGGQSALADKLGISTQAVHKMHKTGRVPAERVLEIEKITGVSRHDLRPDIYPHEAGKKPEVA